MILIWNRDKTRRWGAVKPALLKFMSQWEAEAIADRYRAEYPDQEFVAAEHCPPEEAT